MQEVKDNNRVLEESRLSFWLNLMEQKQVIIREFWLLEQQIYLKNLMMQSEEDL